MSVQGFLEKAFERGERMKGQILEDVVNSRFVNQLLKNEKFLNTVVAVLNAKSGFEKKLHRNFKFVLNFLEIPTRDEITGMEKKIHRIENEIESIHRKVLTRSLRKKAAKTVTSSRKR